MFIMAEILKKRGRKPKESPERIKRELLEFVDENCDPLGILPRGEIHEKGAFHKSVHIFLFNSKGEIFLQRRSLDREEFPGLWSSSASGHVGPGEPLLYGAQRELKEELGIKVKLQEVLQVKPTPETNWECVTLFVGITNKKPKPNPQEIIEGKFFKVEELERMLSENPEIFSPAFRYLWKLYRERKPQE